MDWRQIANEPWIWICGGLLAVVALYQCTHFSLLAARMLKQAGFSNRDLRGIVRSATITCIGPILVELFMMIALVVSLSPGIAWQRQGAAVGSATTELVQSNNAAIAAGQEFGGENFDMIGFATVIFVLNVSCIGWTLDAVILTRYLGRIREKLSRGDKRWLMIMSICTTMGIYCYLASASMVKGGGTLAAVASGAALSMLLFSLANRFNLPRLKEWALGLAMFGGMFFGKFIGG